MTFSAACAAMYLAVGLLEDAVSTRSMGAEASEGASQAAQGGFGKQ